MKRNSLDEGWVKNQIWTFFRELRTLSKLERQKCEHRCKSKGFMSKTTTLASFFKLWKFVIEMNFFLSTFCLDWLRSTLSGIGDPLYILVFGHIIIISTVLTKLGNFYSKTPNSRDRWRLWTSLICSLSSAIVTFLGRILSHLANTHVFLTW